jgi:hypothetical protein
MPSTFRTLTFEFLQIARASANIKKLSAIVKKIKSSISRIALKWNIVIFLRNQKKILKL